MTGPIIATGFNTGGVEGDLDRLAQRLAHMEKIGCTGAEITLTGLDIVIARRILPDRLAALKQITARHDLAYSLHAPIAINLMDNAHAGLMMEAAEVSLEVAAETGAKVVVLHPGRVHPLEHVNRRTALMEEELDRLRRLGDRARALGLRIAYENISPNPRVMAGEETSYSLDPAQLAAQLARLDHPAVMACLDVNHAIQGAGLWGFDMMAACAALSPWVGHIHYADCTGIPASFPVTPAERHFFGTGDMHAPTGFGDIDFDALAEVLSVRPETRIVIEIKRNFHGYAEIATLNAAKAFADRLNRTG